MWICLKCNSQNHDSLNLCWWCHTEPDGTEHPRLIARIRSRLNTINPNEVGIPRRFSLGKLMQLIVFFAVLFSILKICNADAVLYFIIGCLFIVVGITQVLLFKGNKPRKASIIGGVLYVSIFYCIGFVQLYFTGGDLLPLLRTALIMPVFGSFIGYIAGCLLAGVFLIPEREPVEEISCNYDSPDKDD
jgi:hypothetical protein